MHLVLRLGLGGKRVSVAEKHTSRKDKELRLD
jgi:hypothetical protein